MPRRLRFFCLNHLLILKMGWDPAQSIDAILGQALIDFRHRQGRQDLHHRQLHHVLVSTCTVALGTI